MKLLKDVWMTLWRAFLAGICISIGGTVLLSLRDGSAAGNIAGALLFSLGLLTIVTRSLNLFTGKVGDLLRNPPSYLGTLALVWSGNIAGTVVCGNLLRFTRVGDKLSETARTMCEVKLADAPLSILILSFFCGILMYIAVNGYRRMSDSSARTLIVILPVAVFILCGFEHVIANMYYFSVAGVWGARTILYLLLMTAGNAAGSVCFGLFDRE